MFYNSSNNFEYNDCISHGACSVSPNTAFLQDIMLHLLKQTAFYITKLDKLNIDKSDMQLKVIKNVAFLGAFRDLTEEQILEVFKHQYFNLVELRKEYLSEYEKNNLAIKDIKNLLKFSNHTDITSILRKAEQIFKNKNEKAFKYHNEILTGVLKSVCVNIVNLKDYNVSHSEAEKEVINTLDFLNHKNSDEKLKERTELLAKFDIELLKKTAQKQIEYFGKISETEISFSTRPNKAILVSGSNYTDLENLLKYLDNKDIDVYTNGNLLTAHVFENFKKYKNLVGHFGNGVFSSILDFATFPGAILLTQNEAQNIDYLYRGRLFTTDEITPKGVMKIEGNNFDELYNSALEAKGFAKGQNRKSEIAGYNLDDLEQKLDEIANAGCRHIFIIGLSALSAQQQNYFDKFFSMLPEDCYAISFSYKPQGENILSINLGNDYALVYNVITKIFEKIPITSDNLTLFMTKCDINSLSNMINLKAAGAKSVYLSECPPTTINPAVLKEFTKLYGIKILSTVKNDLAEILK